MADSLSSDAKQELYRTARSTNQYDQIWQGVNKCVFCDLRDKYIIFEEHGIVLAVTLFAYIDGHMMIIPRRHVRSNKDLTQIEWQTIRKFLQIAKKMIKNVHGIKGMQLVEKDGSDAQSTVEHIHFHCIPFDAPDLCTWNYRELKYTPLESANLYRKARKDLLKTAVKYEEKYAHQQQFTVICDAVIFDPNGRVLLQTRTDREQFIPASLCLPGGHNDGIHETYQQTAAREIFEETNLVIDAANLQLIASRPGQITRRRTSASLRAAYPEQSHFVWNSYALQLPKAPVKLMPGDDCEKIEWLTLDEVTAHKDINHEIKTIAIEAAIRLGVTNG